MHRKVKQTNSYDCGIYTIDFFTIALQLFKEVDKVVENKRVKKKQEWWETLTKKITDKKKLLGSRNMLQTKSKFNFERKKLAEFYIRFIVLY
jgi:hypothetical protein